MKHSRSKAFTLIELIVVLAILAVLLVVLVPRFSGYIDDARRTAARSDAAAVLQAAELFVAEEERDGRTPPSAITNTDPVLAPYLKALDGDASYSLTITPDPKGGYAISGHYSKGNITVTIPELEATRRAPATP